MQSKTNQPITNLSLGMREKFFYWMLTSKSHKKVMDDILDKLERKRKAVDFQLLYVTLRNAKFGDKWATINIRRSHLTKKWFDDREKLLRDIADIEKRLNNLFIDYDEVVLSVLRQTPKNRQRLPTGRNHRVLTTCQTFTKTVNNSFLLQTSPPSRPRGHQSQPWLTKAKAGFKQAGIPQEVGEDLLRLIGAKPISS